MRYKITSDRERATESEQRGHCSSRPSVPSLVPLRHDQAVVLALGEVFLDAGEDLEERKEVADDAFVAVLVLEQR